MGSCQINSLDDYILFVSLKLFVVGFDVSCSGKCIAAVTKVTLADFQLFFPASVSTSSLLLGRKEREEMIFFRSFYF